MHAPSSENWCGNYDSTLALDVMQAPFGRDAYDLAEAVSVAGVQKMPMWFWYNIFLGDYPPFGRRRGLEVVRYASSDYTALKCVLLVWITKPLPFSICLEHFFCELCINLRAA